MIGQELPADPSMWAEHGGILALIILFLLIGFSMLIRWLVQHLDRQSQQHSEERREFRDHYDKLAESHREERKEWRETNAAANESLRRSVEAQSHDLAAQMEKGLERMAESIKPPDSQ